MKNDKNVDQKTGLEPHEIDEDIMDIWDAEREARNPLPSGWWVIPSVCLSALIVLLVMWVW